MLLDFEKPIHELEAKLAQMKTLAAENKVDVSEATKALEESIAKLKKTTYSNLTRWQRVQLSRHADRPYTLDYIQSMSDTFIELYGDRTVTSRMPGAEEPGYTLYTSRSAGMIALGKIAVKKEW
jgi:acetyl-CoA carboxylase carboxyl transferase subunit alpha